jgi:hypothetical protein
MVQMNPPHPSLESNAARRDAVRRRAVPVAVSLALLVAVVVAVSALCDPKLAAVGLATFGGGVAAGRRL